MNAPRQTPEAKTPGDATAVSDLKRSRERFADVLLKAEAQREALERARLSVAGSLAAGEKRSVDVTSAEVLRDFQRLARDGKELSANILDFCRFLDGQLRSLPVPDDEKTRIRLRVEELRSAAEKFGAHALPERGTRPSKAIQVLDVNDALGVVVLSSGLRDGIRVGLALTAETPDRATLRVVQVRPYVSAALVTRGEMDAIAPGTPARVGSGDAGNAAEDRHKR